MTTVVTDKAQLIEEYVNALDAGDEEGALEIARRIPLHPSLAKAVLSIIGKEDLLANYNLSEANAAFGEGWLDE